MVASVSTCMLTRVFMLMQCSDIVMELMDGGDLLQYILDNEGLTEYHTQQIAYQISDALAVSDCTNPFQQGEAHA